MYETSVPSSQAVWFMDLTSNEMRRLLSAYNLTSFDVQRLVSLAANGDGSADWNKRDIVIYSNVETLSWDVRISNPRSSTDPVRKFGGYSL